MKSLLIASLLLSGCTAIDHGASVAGWPALRVTENKVSFAEMHRNCAKYAHPLALALACAEYDLTEGWCRIWYVWDVHLEHERLHCGGHDHIGGDTMRSSVRATNNQ